MKTILTLILLISVTFHVNANRRSHDLSSPDGANYVNVSINEDGFSLSVRHNGQTTAVIENISMTAGGTCWDGSAGYQRAKKISVDEVLRPVVPRKFSESDGSYNLLSLEFRNYTFQVRAYNEGVAYRFVGKQKIEATIDEETADFVFAPDCQSFTQLTDKVQNWFEYHYTVAALSELDQSEFSLMPLLVKSEGANVLIHEVDLYGYAASYLRPTGQGFELMSVNYPAKEDWYEGTNKIYVVEREDYIVKTQLQRPFPWRVLGIYDSDAEILAATLPDAVCRQPEGDWSWVKPGKALWDWWNGNNIFGVDFKAGINTDTYMYMVDYAAGHGLEYILIDEGWSAKETLLELAPGVDIPAVCKRASEKGVGIILWSKWLNVEREMDQAFALLKSWGVAGLKIDWMDRNDAKMVDFYERVLKKASEYQLLIDFHGSYPPDGMETTYPNLLTREGVYGLENSRWRTDCTPSHQVSLPFIRQWAGPMDFTPGSMLNAQPEAFRTVVGEPMSQGTRCHQLAMYIVYESPLQMLSDSPTKYDENPQSLAFLSEVPVTWDETVALMGSIGEYAGVARRCGDTWYIGLMNGLDSAMSVEIPLDFLGGGQFSMKLYSDGVNAAVNAKDYRISESDVSASDSLSVELARNGGAVAVLSPMSSLAMGNADKLSVIIDTDLGNDVDDALALDILYKYANQGKVEILGIMINKEGQASAELADIMNTWYGYPDVPIGIVRDGAECSSEALDYAQKVCGMTGPDGKPLFAGTLDSYDSLPDAHQLYREILAGRQDSSVVIVSVGFSTNLARLLDTQGDEYSELSGCELVAAKVKKLVTMAGCFDDPAMCEYNVVKDIPAAKKVFEQWPGEVVTSPFEVGSGILFPAASIENDFTWAPAHPLVEAYKSFLQMPYDRPCWDLTALMYAVEGGEAFSISPSGRIEVRDDGSTSFIPDSSSNRYYLLTDEIQDQQISSHLLSLISSR